MERPPPRGSASPSSPPPSLQWLPRSHISIFIHTLHLLNLDLLPTWPTISEPTYTTSKPAQNLQARVKSTEWSLYHLFRLYSPTETQARLSAYFPAASPLQSKNLRAGLFKWLSELKASGVLPRECVLRKTMLDECRGEKFEEALARFAMVVLKKSMRKLKQGRDTLRSVEEQDVENLVPLIVGYRSALQQSLQRRKDLEEKAAVFSAQLARVRTNIDSSLHEIQSQPAKENRAGETLSEKELDRIHDQVNLAFAKNRHWARFIFEGSAEPSLTPSARELPVWPFDTDNTTTNPEHLTKNDEQDTIDGPLRQLQSLLSRRQERLQRLTRLRDSLLPTDAPSKMAHVKDIPAPTATTSHTFKPRFNKHQGLTLKL